jgi:hypothetical protein
MQPLAEFNQGRAADAQIHIDIKRMLMAHSMKPLAGNASWSAPSNNTAKPFLGEPIPAMGTPLYTDVRLYVRKAFRV